MTQVTPTPAKPTADLKESIEGIAFSNVLIIENKPAEIQILMDDLKNSNLMVTLVATSKAAKSILGLNPQLNLLILDWLLNEQDSMEAKELVKIFRKNRIFTPIIIYTDKNIDEPTKFIKEEGLDRLTIVLNKHDVKGDEVFKRLNEWLTKEPELRIFLRWAREIEKGKNATLWSIHDLKIGGVRELIEAIVPNDDSQPVGQELISFFGKILTRQIEHDDDFLKAIRKEAKDLIKSKPTVTIEKDKLREFYTFERYKTPNKHPLWTGSILKKTNGNYFVVVTPVCDFSHDSKIESVLLIESEPLKKYRKKRGVKNEKCEPCIKNEKYPVHYLAYTPSLPEGLMCRFDRISNIETEKLQGMLKEGKMTCVGILDSPFIENFIQRMNAYLMRLGVRDLDGGEIQHLLESTKLKS